MPLLAYNPILAKYDQQTIQSMPMEQLKGLNLGTYIPDFNLINYDTFDYTQISDLQQAFINLFDPIQSRASSAETSSIVVTNSPSYLYVWVIDMCNCLPNKIFRSTSNRLLRPTLEILSRLLSKLQFHQDLLLLKHLYRLEFYQVLIFWPPSHLRGLMTLSIFLAKEVNSIYFMFLLWSHLINL